MIATRLKYLTCLLHWWAIDAAQAAVRRTLLRLCDWGVALAARSTHAEISARVLQVQWLNERRRLGMRSLRRGLREERRQHPWPARRLDAADAARADAAAVEACAVEQPRPTASVHPIHGAAVPQQAGGAACRRPS